MLFSVQSRNRNLPLIVSIDRDVPLSLKLDPVRVKQIINNLLGNAFKFTERGSVKLSLYLLHTEAPGQNHLAIEVEDTGIGMTEEEQGRLFKEFSQADRSIVRRYGGSGLGLIICKKLAELMGGEIALRSQEGKGSRFIVSLPVAETPLASPVVSGLQGKKVMVVESEGLARESYRRLLQRWGMEVTIASCLSGNDQLRQYDLLVLGGSCASECARIEGMSQVPAVLQLGVRYVDLSRKGKMQAHFLHTPVVLKKLRQELLLLLAPEQATVVQRRHGLSDAGWSELQVLVAEDNPVNQLVVRRLLEKLNISPVIVDDGRQAVDYACSNPVDLVLMDCDMPVMDGYQATKSIRDSGLENIWIIGLSAKAAEEEVQQALDSGMDAYLPKPVMLEQLREAIQNSAPVSRLQAKSSKSVSGH